MNSLIRYLCGSFIFLANFFPQVIWASYSRSVFEIPCEEIKLKIKSCQKREYSSRDFRQSFRKIKNPILYSGSLVQGEIQEQRGVKCSENQKVNMQKYKKRTFEIGQSFFIENFTCKKAIVNLRVTKTFCDTPGAIEIPSCLINLIQKKEKTVFTVISKPTVK